MNDESQWNNNRNKNKGSNYSGRKQSEPKYTDNKGNNYSPSASYNYKQNGRGQGQNYQQHPRRRIDRYKRESINTTDRVIKQNDIIIKLLKEIRDNLAGPQRPVKEPESVSQELQNQGTELTESTGTGGESKPQDTNSEKELESNTQESESVSDTETVLENAEEISADSDKDSQ